VRPALQAGLAWQILRRAEFAVSVNILALLQLAVDAIFSSTVEEADSFNG
jgi:hypothetical protein